MKPTTTQPVNFNILSEKIRAIRQAKGYSQESIAEMLGISQSTYSHWESEPGKVQLDQFRQLADALEIEWRTLLGTDEGFFVFNTSSIHKGTKNNNNANIGKYIINDQSLVDLIEAQKGEIQALRTCLLDKDKIISYLEAKIQSLELKS